MKSTIKTTDKVITVKPAGVAGYVDLQIMNKRAEATGGLQLGAVLTLAEVGVLLASLEAAAEAAA